MNGTRRLEPVIGIEIHVQLRTRTKMFCGCALAFGQPPNTLTCPVCLGHPGSLPVTNAEAVHLALMIAMAFECEIAERSIFHRKNYFYPDNPKAYQISQYDIPLATAGRLGDVRIHRVHLEEDAAKLVHAGASGRIHGAESSVVDFNRAGTPLVEIVTEPDLRSAAEAAEFGRVLQATLRRMGVSDVNMEEGSLRMDANVSVRPAGETTLGTKTELKNMNSFRFLERGIVAEIERQERILADGGRVEQETLHYDPQDGRHQLAALQGGGPRLPLLPRARPRADRAHAGDAGTRPLGAARAAPGPGRALRARPRAAPGLGSPAGLPRGAGRLPRGDARRRRLGAAPGGELGGERPGRPARGPDARRDEDRARGAGSPGGDGGGRPGGGVGGEGRARRAGGEGR